MVKQDDIDVVEVRLVDVGVMEKGEEPGEACERQVPEDIENMND